MAEQYWFIVFNFGVPLIWIAILVASIIFTYQATDGSWTARSLGWRSLAFAGWIALFFFTLFAVPGMVLLDLAHK